VRVAIAGELAFLDAGALTVSDQDRGFWIHSTAVLQYHSRLEAVECAS